MDKTFKKIEERMDKIENTLDLIANNHLAHLEKYTLWTLIGVVVSVGISMLALWVSIV